ncbi:hypothetical protein MKW92_030082 [Papaver armeniacum]|nr:hypothetical protein MKW92_030082 [Papaver armeniacum]
MAAQVGFYREETDNEIKNYWNTRVKRRQRAGLSLYPNDIHKQGTATFHHNQSYLSQPPHNLSNFSSSQQQKQNFGTPLSLFEPLNLSSATSYPAQQNTAHFISTPINGFKRFRGDNYVNCYHLLQFSSILGIMILINKQTIMQNQYDSTRALAPDFSTKLELPSNQLSQPASDAEYQINDSLSIRSNTQAMGNGEDMKGEGLPSEQEDKCRNHDNALVGDVPSSNGTPPLGLLGGQEWNDSNPNHSSVGKYIEKRKQPTDIELNSAAEEDDDLSNLLDIIPSAMVTDEDTGLDMQQLPSSINTTTTNTTNTTTTNTTISMSHDWTTGGGNNLPEMC